MVVDYRWGHADPFDLAETAGRGLLRLQGSFGSLKGQGHEPGGEITWYHMTIAWWHGQCVKDKLISIDYTSLFLILHRKPWYFRSILPIYSWWNAKWYSEGVLFPPSLPLSLSLTNAGHTCNKALSIMTQILNLITKEMLQLLMTN